jgi:hypothetical protein
MIVFWRQHYCIYFKLCVGRGHCQSEFDRDRALLLSATRQELRAFAVAIVRHFRLKPP